MNDPYKLARTILQSAATPEKTEEWMFSSGDFSSIALYGESVHKKQEDGGTSVSFHLENENGTGDITLYRVFPGIELVYNDMHMAYCNRQQQPASAVMEINYCKEGRSECLFGENQYCYMAAGDLSFCSLQDQAHQSAFPTSHYHGITVTIDFSAVTEEMKKILTLLSVDLDRIRALAQMQDFTLIWANQTVEHIFSELYSVPENIRQGYIRVKMLELLLVLTGMQPEKEKKKRAHFTGVQIDTIKQIHHFLVEHYDKHYTIDALAEQFDMSPTVMKTCFRGGLRRVHLRLYEAVPAAGGRTVIKGEQSDDRRDRFTDRLSEPEQIYLRFLCGLRYATDRIS